MEKTLGTTTRIDQAHGLVRVDFGLPEIPRPQSPDEIAAAAGLVSDRVLAQVQTQADQLAEHLRTRQRALELQEAQLNARSLELENEMRTFRLWASQREEALVERERAIQQRSASLEDRAAEVAASEQALAAQRQTAAELASQRAAELQAHEATAQREREFKERQQQADRELREAKRPLEQRNLRLDAWCRRRQAELERPDRLDVQHRLRPLVVRSDVLVIVVLQRHADQ